MILARLSPDAMNPPPSPKRPFDDVVSLSRIIRLTWPLPGRLADSVETYNKILNSLPVSSQVFEG